VTRAEDGSITPLIAVVIGCCTLIAFATATTGVHLVNEHRTRIIADAAALAGIYGGSDSAVLIAHHNGGKVIEAVDTRNIDGRFTVTVTLKRHSATAHAVDTWALTTSTLEP
jgi:hypothetical protein